MNAAKRGFLFLLFLLLAASTLLNAQTASAQSKPSAPEFSAKYVDLSYNTPTTYGTDQYTGDSIVTQPGYLIDNRSIQFTIKNQPFTPSLDASGNMTDLFFNFRIKGAYGTESNWEYYPFALDGQSTGIYGGIFLFEFNVAPAPVFAIKR
jgi:hypothetical protein